MNHESLRHDLIKAIEAGLTAVSAQKFMIEIIQRERNRIYIALEEPSSIYYQKIDNRDMIVPQSELRVLRSMENAINDAISAGEDARKRLSELDKPQGLYKPELRF
jgi:hypothetical protein